MGRGLGAENPGNLLCCSAACLLWWSDITFHYCDGKFQFIMKARFPSEAQFRLSGQIPLNEKKREREKMKVFIMHY